MASFHMGMLILVTVVVLVGCVDEGTRPSDYQGPWIELDDPVHDFGDMYTDHRSSHDFLVRNRGQETLKIEQVKHECGCTKPVFTTRTIAPGEAAGMTVQFHPPHVGSIDKKIRIYSNDVHARETVVSIRARGLGPARLEPSRIRFEGEVGAAGISRDMVLKVRPGKIIKDVRFICVSPWIQIKPTTPFSRESVGFKLDLAGPPAPMFIRESIQTYVTTQEDGKTVQFLLPVPLQVTGRVRPVSWAVPGVVHLGALDPATTRVRRVELHVPDDRGQPSAIRVEGVAGVEVHPVGDPGVYEIRATVESPPGRLVGSVLFDFTGHETIVVPIHGWVLS